MLHVEQIVNLLKYRNMKKSIKIIGSMLIASFAMQSCLDFDDPGAELGVNQATTEKIDLQSGKADSIRYMYEPTLEGVTLAIDSLNKGYYLELSLTGQYCMRGCKEGDGPGEHAYQRQYSLGPDNYAQYFTVPHKKFMYGALTSTYNISAEFNGDPHGAYTMSKNCFMPILHHPMIDSIPEIKAINLLYFSLMAQERADLSGPFTYFEDKQNSQSPQTYNTVKDIYYSIVENLDTIVNCLKYYDNRPQWYKDKIEEILTMYNQTTRHLLTGATGVVPYIKLANSLKLRMAMHIAKVEPATAQKWAEEAVASGVVESFDEQMGLFPVITGFTHPLVNISAWGDTRLSASFESLLLSLDHPYTKYLFTKNSNLIINKETKEETPAGTRICGIRSGTYVPQGQTYAENMYQAFSTISQDIMGTACPPCYFLKWAEVDFLRAEGALRGWNMGGEAKLFYERGIMNASLEDPMMAEYLPEESKYSNMVEDYMKQTTYWVDSLGKPYVSIDPMGEGEPLESVTKIGVAWNEGDEYETKLEKIITQKYIALFPLSTEAWTEMRRTGYPKMFDVLNPDDGDGSLFLGDIIRRIPWVPTDAAGIAMVQSSGIEALGGPDEQATRLWWDVE